jgi:lysophospholipase L1-like esterase
MPLGDSTTGSVCWRADLWQMLNGAGHTGKFKYVGSRHNDPGCNVAGYDQTNEGHPGVLVTNFVNDADELTAGVQTLQSVLGTNPADVVLFHFATNDIWNNIANATILAAYSKVLAALRQANPNVVVLVAQLIPMDVTAMTCSGCSCATCPTHIMSFNAALAGATGWAATNSTVASPIIVVDQWTGFNASAGQDTVDGVHPNASGSTKIAAKWLNALAPYF